MLRLELAESDLHIHYRHYLLPAALMILPPLLFIEQLPGLADGRIVDEIRDYLGAAPGRP